MFRFATETFPRRAHFACAALLIAMFAACPARAEPIASHPLDGTWSNEFALPGFDAPPRCLLDDGNRLLMGGEFVQVGEVGARHIVAWDGQGFAPLGNGVPFVTRALMRQGGLVYAGGGGRLPAGGYGKAPGERKAAPLAYDNTLVSVWDGQSWTSLGGDIGHVSAFAIYKGSLVAGGYGIDYMHAPGQPQLTHRNLCRWDGTNWASLGTAADAVMQSVTALAALRDSLYVGSDYDPSASSRVRVWNGVTYGVPGAGLTGTVSGVSRINDLVTDGEFVYAAGAFTATGSTFLGSTVARFDGSQWTRVGHATREASGLAFWKGQLVVSFADANGLRRTHVLVAGEWAPIDTSSTAIGLVAHATLDTLLVTSQLTRIAGQPSFGPAAWNGATWRAIEQPWSTNMRGIVYWPGIERYGVGYGSLQEHTGALSTGGALRFGAGDHYGAADGLARWAAGAWSGYSSAPGMAVTAQTVDSTGTLYVGGVVAGPNTTYQRFGRWTGSTWQPLATTAPGVPAALACYSGSLYAAGDVYTNSYDAWGVIQWNGSAWAGPSGCSMGYSGIDDPPVPGGLTRWNGKLIVHGGWMDMYCPTETTYGNGVLAWDGSGFTRVGGFEPAGPADRDVRAAVVHQGKLVFGCWMPDAGAISWDGSTWGSLSAGSSSVMALCVAEGRLFGGGEFYRDDNSLTYGVAEWDGARWNLLGSGMNGPVYGLAEHDGDLYATGAFTQANGRTSFGIARWLGLTRLDAPAPEAGARLALASPRPNPSRGAQRFAFTLPTASHVRLAIHDVTGRRVATLLDESRSAGTHAATWDGRDASGTPVAPGLYFARLRTAAGTASASVVRVR